tara:strand:- start:1575 stop:2234 length:660 start_codon:yes stop_codon:yes gene_type:complete
MELDRTHVSSVLKKNSTLVLSGKSLKTIIHDLEKLVPCYLYILPDELRFLILSIFFNFGKNHHKNIEKISRNYIVAILLLGKDYKRFFYNFLKIDPISYLKTIHENKTLIYNEIKKQKNKIGTENVAVYFNKEKCGEILLCYLEDWYTPLKFVSNHVLDFPCNISFHSTTLAFKTKNILPYENYWTDVIQISNNDYRIIRYINKKPFHVVSISDKKQEF